MLCFSLSPGLLVCISTGALMSRWFAVVLFASLALTATTVRAIDPVIQEFELSTPGHRPQAIALGPDGNFWVTEVIKHKIIRVTPEGKVTEFPVPGEGVGVLQGISPGPDKQIYFTSREENAVRRMTTDGKFGETYKIPSTAIDPKSLTKGSWPRAISTGADGAVYFAEMAANKIGRIGADGKMTEFAIPTADSKPYAVVAGPDKMIWFTESGGDKIGRLDPATGKIDEFDLPTGSPGTSMSLTSTK